MYPQDWKLVDESGKNMGLSTSSTLRVIVRQWAQQFKTAMQRGSVADADADMDTRDQAQLAALAAANRAAGEAA